MGPNLSFDAVDIQYGYEPRFAIVHVKQHSAGLPLGWEHQGDDLQQW